MTELDTEQPVNQALELRQPDAHGISLVGAANPRQFVERVSEVATALAEIIMRRGLYADIGGKRYVEVEGWTTLGSMMGVFGSAVYAVPDGDPEWVEIDGVKGVKATMKAVTVEGAVVGGATSYCMRNEQRWRNADFYALAGMAQTRATSRALRQPLGFVMKLAGFEATAESEAPGQKLPKTPKAAQAAKAKVKQLPTREVLKAQIAQGLQALEGNDDWTEENVLKGATQSFGKEVASFDDLTDTEMEAIIAAMTKTMNAPNGADEIEALADEEITGSQ